jgi:hypothetical protein
VFVGQHYDESLMALEGLRFGENLEAKFGESWMRNMQCNVTFGCQLGVNFMTQENHGKP